MSIVIAHEELVQDGSVRQKIAERAYFIAEQQGFAPGHAETNWHLAEAEVIAALQSNGIAPTPEAVVAKVKKPAAKKAAPKTETAVTGAAINGVAAPRKRAPKKSD